MRRVRYVFILHDDIIIGSSLLGSLYNECSIFRIVPTIVLYHRIVLIVSSRTRRLHIIIIYARAGHQSTVVVIIMQLSFMSLSTALAESLKFDHCQIWTFSSVRINERLSEETK